jgi:pseudouridine-5'-phosphate glycosidase
VEGPDGAIALVRALAAMRAEAGVLLCNPIPEAAAMDPHVVAEAVASCEAEAERLGVRGKDVTPFLLSCLAERTGGASMDANLVLLEENARLAGQIAAANAAL